MVHNERHSHTIPGTVLISQDGWSQHLRHDTVEGLKGSPPSTPPVWFYDEHGSELFARIMGLPEYYLSRAEHSLLLDVASDIAKSSGTESLVELGAGSAEKTQILIDAMNKTGHLSSYVPTDVSQEALEQAAVSVQDHFKKLDVHYVVCDFTKHLGQLPTLGKRTVAFLGSTLGNFTVPQRRRFLEDMSASLIEGEHFLVGTDLVKDSSVIEAAYNDSEGVTAQFNLNALRVMNAELGANFDVEAFSHTAPWVSEHQRIEMRLVAETAQEIWFEELQMGISLMPGQWLCSEYSHKFTADDVRDELESVGLVVNKQWLSHDDGYALTLASKESS